MITLIILIILIVIGVYLTTKWDYELLGIIICFIFGLYLIAHVIALGLASYKYELFVEKRNTFKQTLEIARENGNKYEIATITKEIIQWNVILAEYKYDNNIFLLDEYIDDRFKLLKPIK